MELAVDAAGRGENRGHKGWSVVDGHIAPRYNDGTKRGRSRVWPADNSLPRTDDDVYFTIFAGAAPNPICPSDSGGRAGFLTKLYKIEEVQIL